MRRTRVAIFITYTCLESVQSFVLNALAKKAHIHTHLIEYACYNQLKTYDITEHSSLVAQVEEQEVECDEPLMLLENCQ